MALPNPLTFPVRVENIVSSGPDSSGKYKFIYTMNRTTGGVANPVSVVITATLDNQDDYPIGQTLNISFTTTP